MNAELPEVILRLHQLRDELVQLSGYLKEFKFQTEHSEREAVAAKATELLERVQKELGRKTE